MAGRAHIFIMRPSSCTKLRWRAAVLAAALLSSAASAFARPPENSDPDLAPWFQGLRSPNGASCCSIADCRTTDYRTNANGYEALIDGQWLVVPPDRVLDHISNPTGRAVVCYAPALGILCFVRPSES
jgi:hypothetical protein